MIRTVLLQEMRKMPFGDIYDNWQKRWLIQKEAAQLLGTRPRTFGRYVYCYPEGTAAAFHEPRRMATYDPDATLLSLDRNDSNWSLRKTTSSSNLINIT